MSPGPPGGPRSQKQQEGPSAGASGGSVVLGLLDFGHLVSRTERGLASVVWSVHV